MPRPPTRVYADTSVFGGVFDVEYDTLSRRFFEAVERGEFQLVTSVLVQQELAPAPELVRELFARMSVGAEMVESEEEAEALMQGYLQQGIVSPRFETDALHVATATVNRCTVIVSWNFKHIVNFRRIALYNGVNILRGYDTISIHSPRELVDDD